MRLNIKITLAGLISTTGIGLAGMYESVEAYQQQPTNDTTVVLNKDVSNKDKTNPTCKFVHFPLGGK